MAKGPFDDILPPVNDDEVQFMGEELTSLLSIAQKGDNLPLAGGTICAWWGLLLWLTNMYQAAAYLEYVPGPVFIGGIQVVLGYIGTFALMRMERKHRLLVSWRTQTIAAIWLFSGVAICVFSIGVIITGFDNDVVINVFLSLVFAINFAAMATTRRGRWLLIPAIGWIMAAVLSFFFAQSSAILNLIFGGAGFAFMLVPGLVLRHQEKKVTA